MSSQAAACNALHTLSERLARWLLMSRDRLAALDGDDALERAGGGGTDADLILVDLVGKPAEAALEVGRRVRERAKYNGHTPLVVMPEKYGKDVEGTEVNLEGDDWIFYLGEEHDQLRNLLSRLLR